MSNINENICQAIDIIIQERLSHISFDSTILCKIVDDSKKERGVYVVKSDEVRFEAYSTLNTLAVGDSVYVQIPNGDWNEQKFILSKKTLSDENPSLTYKNPFANFIDITGNLISNAQTVDYGLIANSSNEAIKIWEYNVAEQEEPLKGYTTLGLKAGFKTLLNPFFYGEEGSTKKSSNVTKGDYGLRLTIISKLENLVKKPDEQENKQEIVKVAKYTLELNEENMNGNPYNFSTYSNQEIIFDIGQIDNILTMSLEFYQKPTSFTDNNGIKIPESVKANLLVNNVGVYLGYRVDEINEEKVLIYSNDSSTYSAEAVDKTANNKKVRLRWIYKDAVSGSFRSVQPSDGMNFEVRWYRYRLGMPPADEYSGIYWIPLSKQTYDVDNKKYIYEVQDTDWLGQYAGVKPEFLTSWIFSDTEQPIEKVKAVILYNGQVYRSEILEFTNEKEVYSNDGIMDAVEDMFKELTALNIICKDDSFGNYFIYNEDYKLINQSDSAIPRQFLAYLALPDANGNYKDIQAPIDNAEQIKWYLPTDNTMIRFKNEDLVGFETSTEIKQGITYKVITKKADSSNQVHNSLTYYISSLYNHYYGNNNVLCEVTLQDGTVYSSAKELDFGVSGSNGTDVKLVLDFLTPGANGLDAGSGSVDVTAKLYDSTGKDITKEATDLSSTSWSWEFVGNDIKGLYISEELNSETNKRIFKLTGDLNIFNTWNVLKCTLTGWGAYDLEAYLPIPIYQNVSSNYIENLDIIKPIAIDGTTEIIYTTEGLPQYNRGLYCLHYQDIEKIKQINYEEGFIDWQLITPDDNKLTYPRFYEETKRNEQDTGWDKIGYSLQPCEFYDSTAEQGVIVQAKLGETIIWSQPILILQNTYFSSSINNWGGEVKVDESGGMVAAPKIAAGIKTKDNKLTGVILGEYGTESNNLQTGLYGFRDGATTFGFRADGTAFIGQSSGARIEFDGSKSQIKSASWDLVDVNNPNSEAAGTLFDLDNGLIKIQRNAKVTTKDDEGNEIEEIKQYLIKLDSSTTFGEDTYPFTIGDNFKVKWDGSIEATNGKFTGIIDAKQGGTIGGWSINQDGLSKSGVILGGTDYAFNAGAFTVKYDGTVVANNIATNGMKATNINITSGSITGTAITLQGSSVSITASDGKTGLKIDSTGATFNGNINIADGSISFSQLNSITQNKIDNAAQDAADAMNAASDAATAASNAMTEAKGGSNLKRISQLLNGESVDDINLESPFIHQNFIYSPKIIVGEETFIEGTSIYSPQIYTNDLSIISKDNSQGTEHYLHFYESSGEEIFKIGGVRLLSGDGETATQYIYLNANIIGLSSREVQFPGNISIKESDNSGETAYALIKSTNSVNRRLNFENFQAIDFSACDKVILPTDTSGINVVAVFA